MDTVASDVRLFVKKYNITANEEVLPEQRRRHVHDDNVFNKIYAQVPIEEILPLREIFQEDFDMFGYSFEQDLIKILQGKSTGDAGILWRTLALEVADFAGVEDSDRSTVCTSTW
ncbi:hypothetical protein Bbelb_256020 [Branchiostoma belcheri]|nr:hypothetical protein Bbelb_256020 [Branchiostoma belcheri]